MLEQVLSCVRLGIIFLGDRHTNHLARRARFVHVPARSTVADGTTAGRLPKPGIYVSERKKTKQISIAFFFVDRPFYDT